MAPSFCRKPLLCYHCGLRMASMLQATPPPVPRTVLNEVWPKLDQQCNAPIVVSSNVNALFDFVYETEASVRRMLPYVQGARSTTGGDDSYEIILDATHSFSLSFCEEGERQQQDIFLCTACCGLYQFMDEIIAPLASASVRLSPFVDSTALSVNINVARSMSFIWLTTAAYFKAGLPGAPLEKKDVTFQVATSCADNELPLKSFSLAETAPNPSVIIPEEYCNFKEFYMGDVRARILKYLSKRWDEVSTIIDAEDAASTHRSGAEIGGSLHKATVIASLAARLAPEGVGSRKRPRDSSDPTARGSSTNYLGTGDFCDSSIPTLCEQAFEYAPQGTGVALELESRPSCCYERLAIADSTEAQSNSRKSGMSPAESVVPAQYCSNKGGCVMRWGMVYEYVVPHFVEHGLGLFAFCRFSSNDPSLTWDVELSGTIPRHVSPVADAAVAVQHANVFLIGSYRKMLRSLSQSPWFCEGGRIGSFSLQEVIAAPILRSAFPFGIPPSVLPGNVFKRQQRTEAYVQTLSTVQKEEYDANRKSKGRNPATVSHEVDPFDIAMQQVLGYGHYKFHSAGREDVDVRMLGTGRPFVVELISPHRQSFSDEELRELEARVSESEGGCVEIENLRFTTSDITVDLARHSESKTKTYRCMVWCSRPIQSSSDAILLQVNALKDIVVSQRTPLRVLHRRSLLDRPKVIHSIFCERVNDHWLTVTLETQAGTYVKEFIHGDNGRTVPSLGVLLQGRTDIIQLDVLGMVMPEL